MYMIAGLGNPGEEYEHTRHNAGFDTVDALADELGVTVTAPDGMLWLKDDGRYSIGENEDENTGSMVEYKPRRKH